MRPVRPLGLLATLGWVSATAALPQASYAYNGGSQTCSSEPDLTVFVTIAPNAQAPTSVLVETILDTLTITSTVAALTTTVVLPAEQSGSLSGVGAFSASTPCPSSSDIYGQVSPILGGGQSAPSVGLGPASTPCELSSESPVETPAPLSIVPPTGPGETAMPTTPCTNANSQAAGNSMNPGGPFQPATPCATSNAAQTANPSSEGPVTVTVTEQAPASPAEMTVTIYANSGPVAPASPLTSSSCSTEEQASAQLPYSEPAASGPVVLTYTLPAGPSSPEFTGYITVTPESGPTAAPNPAGSSIAPESSPCESGLESNSAQQPTVVTVTETMNAGPAAEPSPNGPPSTPSSTPCETEIQSNSAEQPATVTVTETEQASPTSEPSPIEKSSSPSTSPCETGSASNSAQQPGVVTVTETENSGPTAIPGAGGYSSPSTSPCESSTAPNIAQQPSPVTATESQNSEPTAAAESSPCESTSLTSTVTIFKTISAISPIAPAPYESPATSAAEATLSLVTLTIIQPPAPAPTSAEGPSPYPALSATAPAVNPYGSLSPNAAGQTTSTIEVIQTITLIPPGVAGSSASAEGSPTQLSASTYGTVWSYGSAPFAGQGASIASAGGVSSPQQTGLASYGSPYESYGANTNSLGVNAPQTVPIATYTIPGYGGQPGPAGAGQPSALSSASPVQSASSEPVIIVFTTLAPYDQSLQPSPYESQTSLASAGFSSPAETNTIPGYGQPTQPTESAAAATVGAYSVEPVPGGLTMASSLAATAAPAEETLSESEIVITYTLPGEYGYPNTVITFTTDIVAQPSQTAEPIGPLTPSLSPLAPQLTFPPASSQLSPVAVTYTVPASYGQSSQVITFTTNLPVPGQSQAGGPTGSIPSLPIITMYPGGSSSGSAEPSFGSTFATTPFIGSGSGPLSTAGGQPSGLSAAPWDATGSLSVPCESALSESAPASEPTGGELSAPGPFGSGESTAAAASWTTLWPLPSTFSTSCTTPGQGFASPPPQPTTPSIPIGGYSFMSSASSSPMASGSALPLSATGPFGNFSVAATTGATSPITISIVGPTSAASLTAGLTATSLMSSMIPSVSVTHIGTFSLNSTAPSSSLPSTNPLLSSAAGGLSVSEVGTTSAPSATAPASTTTPSASSADTLSSSSGANATSFGIPSSLSAPFSSSGAASAAPTSAPASANTSVPASITGLGSLTSSSASTTLNTVVSPISSLLSNATGSLTARHARAIEPTLRPMRLPRRHAAH